MSRLNPWIRRVAEARDSEPSDTQGISSVVASGRIPLLDGFRAVAVMLVVLAHGCQMSDFPFRSALQSVLIEGQIGVDIFFVLSGFLITSLLIREKRRTGSVSIGQFFLRRSIRILPAYGAFLFVVMLLERSGPATLSFSDWQGALTYTTNFLWDPAWRLGHLWSLSIEEHFYLVWPFVFSLLPQRNRWIAPVICIVFSVATRTVLYREFPDVAWMVNRWTFTRCDAICVGCLLSLAASSKLQSSWLQKFTGMMHPVAFAGALLVSIILGRASYTYAIILAPVINGIFIAGVIGSCLVRPGNSSVRWLDHRILKIVGVRSYSIYLWQQLILVPEAKSFGGVWLFDIVFVLIIAEASWRLVECPALALKGWVSKKCSTLNGKQAYEPVFESNGLDVGHMQSVVPTAQIHLMVNGIACGGERISLNAIPLSSNSFYQTEQTANV